MRWLIIIFCMLFSSATFGQHLTSWTDKNTCLFGYKNDKGDWVIPATYAYAGDFNEQTGLAIVGNGDLYGLIGKDGRLHGGIKYKNISNQLISELVPSVKGNFKILCMF